MHLKIAGVETLPELWGRPLAGVLQSVIRMQRKGARFTGLNKHLRHSLRFAISSDADVQMLGHRHDATITDGAIAFVRQNFGGVPGRPVIEEILARENIIYMVSGNQAKKKSWHE